MKYGIFDTQDKIWLGNKRGPFSYRGKQIAKAAATVANWRMETLIRFQVKKLPGKPYRANGEITPPLSLLEALRRHKA